MKKFIKQNKIKIIFIFFLISLLIFFLIVFLPNSKPKSKPTIIKPRILSTEEHLTKKEKEFIFNEFKKVDYKKYEYYMVFVVNKDFSLKKIYETTDYHPIQVSSNIYKIIEKFENENKEKVLLVHNHLPSNFNLVPSIADMRVAKHQTEILKQKWPKINVFSIIVCVEENEKRNIRRVLYDELEKELVIKNGNIPGYYTKEWL